MTSPVVLIIYNRHELTKKVFNSIAVIKPSKLFIIADGPKNSEDETKCADARKVVENINWTCEVHRSYSDTNMGCQKRIVSGLDWVFTNVDRAIILEDDCLPDKTFFRFCDELLDKYADDERVFMISGNNFLDGNHGLETSYYFSKLTNTWGWATWKRSWLTLDISLSNWPEFKSSNWLAGIYQNEEFIKYWTEKYDYLYYNKNQIWDYYFQYSAWFNNAYSINPNTNLVSNIGFGADATHTKNISDNYENRLSKMPRKEMKFSLVHPKEIKAHYEFDDIVFERAYKNPFPQKQPMFIKRLLRKILNNISY